MKKLLIVCLFLIITDARADISFVKIERVTVLNEKAYIKVSSLPTNRPACATNTAFHFAIPINNDNGKATFSMILTALTSKSDVSIRSMNTCTFVSNVEDLRYLILE